MTADKIYLTDDQRAFEFLQNAQLPVHRATGDDMPDLRGREIIVVGRNGDARKSAFDLVSRGVPADAVNYVESDGKTSLAALLRNPRHLFWDDARPLLLAPEEDRVRVYRSGIPALEPNLFWRDTELCITCGPYASGKSLLAQILAVNFVCENGEDDWGAQHDADGVVLPKMPGCSALLCSWEDMPSKMRQTARKIALSKGFDPSVILDRVHYVCRNQSEDRFISWFVDLVRYYANRYNTRFFVFDPWNEFDHVKDSRQSETDYVRDMMKAFRRLVDELKIILNIVTHVPARMVKGNSDIEPFRMAHAFGSSQFAAKADRGFCVVRSRKLIEGDPRSDHMGIRFDKVKIQPDMGVEGVGAFEFNRETCGLKFSGEATEALREAWW